MSIAVHRAHALIERVDRLVDHRQQDAVDDEGREVLRRRRLLAELHGQALGAAVKVSSSVARPRISSTSSITGTGFMKCMPMNWLAGRSVTAARRVIEIEEVLEAIIALGFSSGEQPSS